MTGPRCATPALVMVALLIAACSGSATAVIDAGVPAINGIPCYADVPAVPTKPVRLVATVDGVPFALPANLGVMPSCTYGLHTDAAGQIVVVIDPSMPALTHMSLFEFTTTLAPTDVQGVGHVILALARGTVTVNGAEIASPPDETPLRAGDDIVATYVNP